MSYHNYCKALQYGIHNDVKLSVCMSYMLVPLWAAHTQLGSPSLKCMILWSCQSFIIYFALKCKALQSVWYTLTRCNVTLSVCMSYMLVLTVSRPFSCFASIQQPCKHTVPWQVICSCFAYYIQVLCKYAVCTHRLVLLQRHQAALQNTSLHRLHTDCKQIAQSANMHTICNSAKLYSRHADRMFTLISS